MKNRYQDALDRLSVLVWETHVEDKAIIQELIDKNSKAKALCLLDDWGDIVDTICAGCDYNHPSLSDIYCSHCGKELDWGEDNE